MPAASLTARCAPPGYRHAVDHSVAQARAAMEPAASRPCGFVPEDRIENCSLLQPIAVFGEGSPADSPHAAKSTTNSRDGRRSHVRSPQLAELCVVEAGPLAARLGAGIGLSDRLSQCRVNGHQRAPQHARDENRSDPLALRIVRSEIGARSYTYKMR